MNHTFNFQSIWDAFTSAASLVVAEGAFDSVRASLDEGHGVKIIMGEAKSLWNLPRGRISINGYRSLKASCSPLL